MQEYGTFSRELILVPDLVTGLLFLCLSVCWFAFVLKHKLRTDKIYDLTNFIIIVFHISSFDIYNLEIHKQEADKSFADVSQAGFIK